MLKKSFKKIVAAALTAAMMMGMSTSVFAESSELFPSNTLIGQTPNGTTVSYAEAMEISDRLKNAQDNAYFIEESFAFVDGKNEMFSQKLSDDFFSDKVREHFSENDASSDGMQIANVFTKTFYVVADKYGVEIPISKEEYQKIESAPAKPYDSYDDVGTYSMWLTVFERTGADREYEFVAQLTHDGDIGIRIKDDKNIGIAWAGKEAVLDTDVFGQYSTGYNKFGSVKSSAPNQNVLFSTFGSDGPQSSYLTLLEASVTVGAYGRTNQINNVIYQYLYTYLTLFPSISSNGSFGFTTGTTTAQHGLVGEYIS